MRRVYLLVLLVSIGSCRKDEPAPIVAAPVAKITPDAARQAIVKAPAVVGPLTIDPAPSATGSTPLQLIFATGMQGQFDNWGRPNHRLGGIGRQAQQAQLWRKEKGPKSVLHVVVGDTLVPPPGDLPHIDGDAPLRDRRASMIAQSLAAAGVQALVPGMSDFALGPARLVAVAKKHRLPILLSNVRGPDGKSMFAPHLLVQVGGVKMGLFGIVMGVSPPAGAPFTLTDPTQAARAAVSALRETGATFIVGMVSVQSGGSLRQLIQEVPGVDVVIRSHEGATTPRAEIVDKTVIVEAGRDGKYLGSLDLHAMSANVSIGKSTIVPLDHERGTVTSVEAMGQAYVRDTIKAAESGKLALVDPRMANAQSPPGRGKAAAKPPLEENWTYASSAACVLCHKEQAAQWQETSHAHALQSLERVKRDHDPDCLTCHTTSFGRPGGTRSLITSAKYFPDVGCETCHGASVAHVRANAKTGTNRQVPAAACTPCHPQSPGETHFDHDRDLPLVMGKDHGARFARPSP